MCFIPHIHMVFRLIGPSTLTPYASLRCHIIMSCPSYPQTTHFVSLGIRSLHAVPSGESFTQAASMSGAHSTTSFSALATKLCRGLYSTAPVGLLLGSSAVGSSTLSLPTLLKQSHTSMPV